MSVIKVHSAVSSTFLTISIIFAIASVYTISENLSDGLIDRIPYGVSLVLLSVLTLVTGVTSISTEKTFITTILLCISAVWNSVGITHIYNGITSAINVSNSSISETELYFPGFSSYMLIFVIFLIGSLGHKDFKLGAVISVICVILYIFEILNLWVHIGGTEIIYILLAVITAFFWFHNAKENFSCSNQVTPSGNKPAHSKQKPKTYDFVIIWYAMNILSFSAFASHVTTVTSNPTYAFSWCLTSGLFQVVMGISAHRRHDAHNATLLLLHGVYWTSISSSMLLNLLLDSTGSIPIPVLSVFIFLFIALSLIDVSLELFRSSYHIVFSLFTLALCIDGFQGTFLGVTGWIGFAFSLYGLSAYISRVSGVSKKIPIGKTIFDKKAIKNKFRNLFKSKVNDVSLQSSANSDLFSKDAMLGYSKYVTMETIGFASNAIAAFSIIWVQADSELYLIPWAVGVGGLVQVTSGFVCFSRGLTFESLSFLIYASFWSIWGSVRGLGLLTIDQGNGIIIGCISFMVAGLLLSVLSTVVNKVWLVISLLFDLIVLCFLLKGLNVMSADVLEIVVSILFALACIYAALSSVIKNALGRDILPTGLPSIQMSKLHSEGTKAVWADGRRTTGVRKIADILNAGGICGIPTDTVYCLVAACNQPEAVERAYNTKKLAEDRPMSVWISNTDQLSEAKEALGQLTWDFMSELWPSNVSLVLKKGEWVHSLGLGYAEKFIGRPDSIAIRIPDSSITCHLIDQTGPIALTSANPTGEADTTHHLQVLAKLGIENCDGILCDGPSRENSASTVVDCREINEGKLGFFRVGLTPKSKVEEIFDRVKQRHSDSGSDSGISQSCDPSDLVVKHLDETESSSSIQRVYTTSLSPAAGKAGKTQVDSYSKIGGQPIRDRSSKQNPLYTEKS